MKPIEIKPQVYWIGALHPDLRVFDIIMSTKNGTTYNSYLIRDEKIAVIDTVKDKFCASFIERITELTDPAKIDYIVVQHNEMDHSGSLQALLKIAPTARVVCPKPAVKFVQKILNHDVDILIADPTQPLSLGKKSLAFIPAPFLHWPDTMMTFLAEDKVLFSCDMFGSHFCDSRLFNDQLNRDFWPEFKYYFDCIFRPFKKYVRNGLQKIAGLPIDMIAPSHGPILRQDPDKYIRAFSAWAAEPVENKPKKVLIYYASAYGNTTAMAEQIARGIESTTAEAVLIDAETVRPGEQLDAVENADGVLFGSPTLNGDAVKPIWDILSSLATIDVKSKPAAAFGSYGWSGEAVGFLTQRLKDLKFKVIEPGMTAVLIPSDEELAKCFEFGKTIGNALK